MLAKDNVDFATAKKIYQDYKQEMIYRASQKQENQQLQQKHTEQLPVDEEFDIVRRDIVKKGAKEAKRPIKPTMTFERKVKSDIDLVNFVFYPAR